MRKVVTSALSAVLSVLAAACDTAGDHAATRVIGTATTAAAATTSVAPPPAPDVRPPDIIVDPAYVSIGTDRVLTSEQGLADKVSVFVTGRPMIDGRTVDVVAMRNARPSQVAAVLLALRRAKAAGAAVKTEARDNTTQRLPLSFDTVLQPCTTIAWIAKDAAIDVWPASGARAKRIIKGLAGPDMTLGTEAVRNVGARCDASELVVGADDAMTWGLVFDLATMALTAPGARATRAVLVTTAVPGHKLVIE
jgi:hypothetical protein